MITGTILTALSVIMAACAVIAYVVWFGTPVALFVIAAYLVIKFFRMHQEGKE